MAILPFLRLKGTAGIVPLAYVRLTSACARSHEKQLAASPGTRSYAVRDSVADVPNDMDFRLDASMQALYAGSGTSLAALSPAVDAERLAGLTFRCKLDWPDSLCHWTRWNVIAKGLLCLTPGLGYR